MKLIKYLLALVLVALSYQQAGAYICEAEDEPSIRECIEAVSDGDTVLVYPGTYYGNIDFLNKNILVASQFIEDSLEETIKATIIDADGEGSVVTMVEVDGTNAGIIGFTLRNGWAEGGGGIYCLNSSGTIGHNIITKNAAGVGGGIYVSGSSPEIDCNQIVTNEAEEGGGIGCNNGTSADIYGNLVKDNHAKVGGGLLITDASSPTISNNTIDSNSADKGGGLSCSEYAAASIKNNLIMNSQGGCGINCSNASELVVSYNDVWNNSGGDFYECPEDIGETSWGENCNGTPCDTFYNIIEDPLFNPDSTNYSVLCTSSCIDAGDRSDSVPSGGGRWTDMGWKEFAYIVGDADGNGTIDVGDYVFLQNYLDYHCHPPCPYGAGDVDCTCEINRKDLDYLREYLFYGGDPPCGN